VGNIRIVEITINNGPCYVVGGPACRCGYHDWIIKPDSAVCSNCGTERNGNFSGYVIDGPICRCGYHQWFVSSNYWVCSNCGQSR